MMARILSKDNFEAFKNYCIEHKLEHDESFLDDEDLDEFEIGKDNPTYLLYDDQELVGVCSLIQDVYHLKGEKARVRIFHCKSNKLEDYQHLMDEILPIDSRVKRIIMFIPDDNKTSREIVEKMGFFVERHAYVLERMGKAPNPYSFPEGYELTDYVANRDEADYAYVRNIAFSTIKGSETPHTLEEVMSYMKEGQILESGAKILRYKGAPVGVVRMIHENEDGKDCSFVAPLALLPEHQGKGLGAMLLRVGINIGVDNGYKDCMLSVNGENENAIKLYIKEGFEKTLEVVCYNKNLV